MHRWLWPQQTYWRSINRGPDRRKRWKVVQDSRIHHPELIIKPLVVDVHLYDRRAEFRSLYAEHLSHAKLYLEMAQASKALYAHQMSAYKKSWLSMQSWLSAGSHTIQVLTPQEVKERDWSQRLKRAFGDTDPRTAEFDPRDVRIAAMQMFLGGGQ